MKCSGTYIRQPAFFASSALGRFFKAPNSKHEAPNLAPWALEIWSLGFLWCLDVGAWSFCKPDGTILDIRPANQ
jgi:hypothetical protein